ncbi:hypothetical protein PRVXT_000232 [Proteinivorax tanatarense]|uniref:Uncharacterized protein n=1 Tax=Proteinivorax tanatarense TaxID=1260629 RepID=A0AAU7VMJ3_9FIRM
MTSKAEILQENFLIIRANFALKYDLASKQELREAGAPVFDTETLKQKIEEFLEDIKNDKEAFLAVEDIIFENAWIDEIFLETIRFYPESFLEKYKGRNKNFLREKIYPRIFEVMRKLNSGKEEDYLHFKDEDIEENHERKRSSDYWLSRNYYLAAKISDEKWGKKIFDDAYRTYQQKKLLENSKLSYYELFRKASTTYAKILTINELWQKVEVGNRVDYCPLTNHKDDILSIAEDILKSGDELLIEEISNLLLPIFMIKDAKIQDLKNDIVKIYWQFKENESVKSNLSILQTMY